MATGKSLTYDRVATILGTVTGLTSARIFKGFKKFSDSDEVLRDMLADGPFIHIKRPKATGGASGGMHNRQDFDIYFCLYTAYDRDNNYDYATLVTLTEAIQVKLLDGSLYTDSFAPILVEQGDDVEIDINPKVVMTPFTMVFQNCSLSAPV